MFETGGNEKGGGVCLFPFIQVLCFVLFGYIRETLLSYPNGAWPLCMTLHDNSWQWSSCLQKRKLVEGHSVWSEDISSRVTGTVGVLLKMESFFKFIGATVVSKIT